MNSSDAFELFSGYLEGELSAEEADRLRRHFEESPEDQLAYDEFAAAVELARALPKAEAPSDFTDRVMRAVREARLTGSESIEHDDSVLPATFSREVHAGSETTSPAAIGADRNRGWWLGAIGIAAMLSLGFFSGRVFLDPAASGPDASAPAVTETPALAVSGESGSRGEGVAADAWWEELQPLADEPLRQVGSGADRPSIVF